MADQVLEHYLSLVNSFTDFLTVATHTILYERGIYPRESFMSARKYNYAVKQNRHPAVCKFVDDAIAAVRTELLKCTPATTSLILVSPTQIPLERYVFNTSAFPVVANNEHYVPFAPPQAPENLQPNQPLPPPEPPSKPRAKPKPRPYHTPLINLHAQFPAVLQRFSTLASSLKPLPPDSTFTFAIELRERPAGVPPIGWPQPWTPSRPGLQFPEEEEGDPEWPWTVISPDGEIHERLDEGVGAGGPDEPGGSGSGESSIFAASEFYSLEEDIEPGDKAGSPSKHRAAAEAHDPSPPSSPSQAKIHREKGKFLGGARTVPIRNVEAGPFLMEVWVEEGMKDVDEFGFEMDDSADSSLSFGEGKGKGKEAAGVYVRPSVEDDSGSEGEIGF